MKASRPMEPYVNLGIPELSNFEFSKYESAA